MRACGSSVAAASKLANRVVQRVFEAKSNPTLGRTLVSWADVVLLGEPRRMFHTGSMLSVNISVVVPEVTTLPSLSTTMSSASCSTSLSM